VVITNKSEYFWPSGFTRDSSNSIGVGNHWLDRDGHVLTVDDGRSSLPYDLTPGNSAEVLLTIAAPNKPGNYILEVDALQENVAWFQDKGSSPLRFYVMVN
jgi:hypothetical protein